MFFPLLFFIPVIFSFFLHPFVFFFHIFHFFCFSLPHLLVDTERVSPVSPVSALPFFSTSMVFHFSFLSVFSSLCLAFCAHFFMFSILTFIHLFLLEHRCTLVAFKCTIDVDSDDSHTLLCSPFVCQDQKMQSQDTRQTWWWGRACRVFLIPLQNRDSLLVSPDEC